MYSAWKTSETLTYASVAFEVGRTSKGHGRLGRMMVRLERGGSVAGSEKPSSETWSSRRIRGGTDKLYCTAGAP